MRWVLIVVGAFIIAIIAIVVVSPFIAEDILNSSTEDLQERALKEGEEKKTTNAVEIISIKAYANKSEDSINNFEILMKLNAGSDPLQMKTFNITMTEQTRHEAELNRKQDCIFDKIKPENEYCFEIMHGDSDTVLTDGEVFKLKYKLEPSNQLTRGEEFEFTFSAGSSRETKAVAKTPTNIETGKISLWTTG